MVSLTVFLFFLIVSYIVICAIAATDKSVAEAYDVPYKARFLKVLKCDMNDDDNIIAICITSFLAAASIFGLFYYLSYKPVTLRIVRQNDVSAEFEQIYTRFGVQHSKKFIENKFKTGISCPPSYKKCFNETFFIKMYEAGKDVSEYATISLDGEYVDFNKKAIDKYCEKNYQEYESNETEENNFKTIDKEN